MPAIVLGVEEVHGPFVFAGLADAHQPLPRGQHGKDRRHVRHGAQRRVDEFHVHPGSAGGLHGMHCSGRSGWQWQEGRDSGSGRWQGGKQGGGTRSRGPVSTFGAICSSCVNQGALLVRAPASGSRALVSVPRGPRGPEYGDLARAPRARFRPELSRSRPATHRSGQEEQRQGPQARGRLHCTGSPQCAGGPETSRERRLGRDAAGGKSAGGRGRGCTSLLV